MCNSGHSGLKTKGSKLQLSNHSSFAFCQSQTCSIMATGLVATRSRATARLNSVSTAMDRSSGYILGGINATPTSASIRRGRDNSIGTLGRSNLETRLRDTSLSRNGSFKDNSNRYVMKYFPEKCVLCPDQLKLHFTLLQ